MTQDPILRRIRDALLRLRHEPARATQPYQETHERVRESVRRLSRARVSQILRQLRATHAFTYADVQARTGLSQQLLFDVEYKDRWLTLDELRLLAECYQVSPEDILGIELD